VTFQVELVWNREFDFVPNGGWHKDIISAITHAKALESMGDGACVKKTRVVNEDGNVVWQYGKMVKSAT
jgi:hypothetical protein